MDLIVCGHAHGGQWRLFGRGVYAPGQGLFPKYTSGVLDGVCVISRGLGNHTRVPRIFNPPELVLISLSPSP
jgi:predicted MPP superfamily phosphohydrolase